MNEYKIESNASKTWTVINDNGDCLFATNTERKAKNFLKRTLEMAGYSIYKITFGHQDDLEAVTMELTAKTALDAIKEVSGTWETEWITKIEKI